MKLRLLCVPVIAALSFIALPALANVAVATVNVQEIMHDSLAAKSVKEQLEAKQKAYQSEMTRKEQDLQKEYQDLAKERSVLSPDAFDKKSKDFQAKANAAQKDAQSKHAELDGAFSSALSEIQKSVFDIVSGIAKEKGYTVVLPTSQMLYADPTLDITKDVLTKLNSTLPKVNVEFKASRSKDEE